MEPIASPAPAPASARSLMYWLLADLFLNCPDEALIDRLRRDLAQAGDCSEAIEQLSALRETLPNEAADISELPVEYTRLFGALSAHHSPRPPYESVHSSRAAAETVAHFYVEAGLVPKEPCAPPDHLGVELRFMALLCHSEAAALSTGEWAEAAAFSRRQQSFLDQHLLQWVPRYLDALQADARHPFYRSLATVTATVLDQDRDAIQTTPIRTRSA